MKKIAVAFTFFFSMGVQRSSSDSVLRGKDNKNYRGTPRGRCV
jgi:hypothetical protein